MSAAPSRVGETVKRALLYVVPDPHQSARLAFCEPDGLVVAELECERSWRRIQRWGEWWRLAGRDRVTAEHVYFREEI